MVKQVKPLERKEEEKKERVEYRPVVAKDNKLSGDTICCLIILIAVVIFLIAGGWRILLVIFYLLAGGW